MAFVQTIVLDSKVQQRLSVVETQTLQFMPTNSQKSEIHAPENKLQYALNGCIYCVHIIIPLKQNGLSPGKSQAPPVPRLPDSRLQRDSFQLGFCY